MTIVLDGGTVVVTTPDVPVAVVQPPTQSVEVSNTPTVYVGAGGSGGVVLRQVTPASVWSWPNPLGRLCGVEVYLDATLVLSDVEVTETTITITHPTPVSGTVVLS